jgi:hypothetical protein
MDSLTIFLTVLIRDSFFYIVMGTVQPLVGCWQAIFSCATAMPSQPVLMPWFSQLVGIEIIGYNDFAYDVRRKLYVTTP